MVFLAVIMFVFGFVAGVGVTLQRCSEDSINDFCENQRLRDEIRRLREQKGADNEQASESEVAED